MSPRKLPLLFCILFLGCSKSAFKKPYGYLELRMEGREESVKWQEITGNWNDSSRKMTIEANGYGAEQCTINLERVMRNGEIHPLNTTMFYFTDGLDFKPFAVSGVLTIIESDSKCARGTFNLFLDNNYNGAAGQRVCGEFGVVNKIE